MTVRKAQMNQHAWGDNLFVASMYLFLTICLLVVLYPLVYMVSASFSAPSAVSSGQVFLWPVRPTLIAYRAVFNHRLIMSGFANSLFYMTAGTSINLVMTMLAAYPLSRAEFPSRGLFTFAFVFTMYFGGGLVPYYLLVNKLGLVDTRAVMLIPGALSVWNMIICRTFLQHTIPDELYQAAQLDGCSEFRMLRQIVLPLSKPILAVMALYYGVGHWNAYFSALIFLSSQRLFPLQLVLRSILVLGQIDYSMMEVLDVRTIQAQQGMAELLKYAVIVVASVPVMCLYPFVQRYFVQGVMVGSLKG